MTIHVTEEHIRKGVRDHCVLCPVALALQEATGKDVRVDRVIIKVRNEEKWLHYSLPDRVIRRIARYDSGKKMKPFSFDVEMEE